jgi:hypothetical protein
MGEVWLEEEGFFESGDSLVQSALQPALDRQGVA